MIRWKSSVSAFVAGFSVMSVELLSSRLLAPVIGTSVLVWTNVIGTILLALAVGAWAGGCIVDRHPSPGLPALALYIGGLLGLVMPLAPVVFSTGLVLVLGFRLLVPVACMLFIAPSAMVLGAVPPMLIRLSAPEGGIGRTAGRVSLWGTAGGITGTYLTGYVLMAQLPVQMVAAVISAVAFIAGALALPRIRAAAVLCSTLAAIPLVMAGDGDAMNVEYPSAYSALSVYQGEYRGNTSTLLLMNNGWPQAAAPMRDAGQSIIPYVALFEDLAERLRPDAKSMLAIGGGACHAPRMWLDAKPGRNAVVVEIDPSVIRAARERFGAAERPDLRMICADARMAVPALPDGIYDVVLFDAFIGGGVPWHLLTAEFWRVLGRKMAPAGIAYVNLVLPVDVFDMRAKAIVSGLAGAAHDAGLPVCASSELLAQGEDSGTDRSYCNVMLIMSRGGLMRQGEIDAAMRSHGLKLGVEYPIQKAGRPYTDSECTAEYDFAAIHADIMESILRSRQMAREIIGTEAGK